MKRDEKGASKYKTVNKIIRNEDMTRPETKKVLKGMEANVLGPARNTRSQAKVTRSKNKGSYNAVVPVQATTKKPKRKPVATVDVDELLSRM